jgi:ankyrin repeat protein
MSLLEDFAKAIEDGELPRIESLLANGSIDANARLPRPRNPPALVLAAGLTNGMCEQKDIVEALLRFGARINDIDDEGLTACHAAAQGVDDTGDVDVVESLLAHQPNLELKCGNGNTVLVTAFKWSHYAISTMLIEAGASLERVDRRFLCQLAAESTSAIRTLLRRDVVVSELRDSQGRTPLHLAVGAGRMNSAAVVAMLVNDCGFDLEVRTRSGSTHLHVACIYNNADAVRLFIAAGANVDSVDKSGRTPLHILSDQKCTILLLAAGADVEARNKVGKTPLMAVASHFGPQFGGSGIQFVRLFVNAMLAGGADLDAADQSGNTARQVLLTDYQMTFDDARPSEEVEAARREIAQFRLDFVRHVRYRAWQVCVGMQSRGLDALQTCEILRHACGPLAPVIAFHQWWKIATTVKHFKASNSHVTN